MIISAGFSENRKDARVERQAGFSYWSVGLFLKGSIELRTGARTFATAQEAIALIPPGIAYNLAFRTDEREIWCIFEPRPELLAILQSKEEQPSASLVALHETAQLPEIEASLRELIRRWEQNPPHVLLAENALERALLLVHEQRDPSPMDERIRKAMDFMLERYAKPIAVSDMARVATLSPSRFAHLFREQTGMTPVQFLDHRRMERARQLLLSTRMPIKEIAEQLGFMNQFHFSTRFRRLTGQSPRNYRQSPQRRWHSLSAL